MIRLTAVRLPIEKPAKLRMQREINLETPINEHLGWQVLVRGPMLVLVSPTHPKGHPDAGKREAYVFPRSACSEAWEIGDDIADLDKIQKYDSPPLKRATPAGASGEAA